MIGDVEQMQVEWPDAAKWYFGEIGGVASDPGQMRVSLSQRCMSLRYIIE
ncbi:hypothetical protein [Bradyrhizobium manausense]